MTPKPQPSQPEHPTEFYAVLDLLPGIDPAFHGIIHIDSPSANSDHAAMRLVIEAAALKALLRIPKSDAQALREKLKTFAADPNATHSWAKAFGGGRGRIRHGDWRALYKIDGAAMIVTVVKVGNRKEVYR
jgi:mRNA interferase RelE/StbE